jgi:hypothetical protein
MGEASIMYVLRPSWGFVEVRDRRRRGLLCQSTPTETSSTLRKPYPGQVRLKMKHEQKGDDRGTVSWLKPLGAACCLGANLDH